MANSTVADLAQSRQLIQEVVENWSMYRDAGDWDRVASVFHEDASVFTLWFQGPAKEFIERSKAIFWNGMASVHYLCGSRIQVANDRAVARTNLKTYGRGLIDGHEYDADATAQFCDLLTERGGRWAISERWVVHVKDRMDPSDPRHPLPLDQQLLASLPGHYRHLAYLHASAGRVVKQDMPGFQGDAAAMLAARCTTWLSGRALRPAY